VGEKVVAVTMFPGCIEKTKLSIGGVVTLKEEDVPDVAPLAPAV